MKPPNFAVFFLLVLMFMMFAIATPAVCQQDNASDILVERVGDTAFIQLHAPSFQALTPRQQALAYLADAGFDRHRPNHLRPHFRFQRHLRIYGSASSSISIGV